MDSERLAQEDELLRQIRLAISSLGTIRSGHSGRKGAMYASTPITSGIDLYLAMQKLGFKSADVFKRTEPLKFQKLVMEPNLRSGDCFGELLRAKGWNTVIVPGRFWAPGWGQTHYMSFWRTVINVFTKNTCQNIGWEYSTGSVEEFLIALRCNIDGKRRKQMFMRKQDHIVRADNRKAADEVRRAIDRIARGNFDPAQLHELWREIVLTIDMTVELARTSVTVKTA